MSGSDSRTGTFHQTQVTTGDTTCSVEGVLVVSWLTSYTNVPLVILRDNSPSVANRQEFPLLHDFSANILGEMFIPRLTCNQYGEPISLSHDLMTRNGNRPHAKVYILEMTGRTAHETVCSGQAIELQMKITCR